MDEVLTVHTKWRWRLEHPGKQWPDQSATAWIQLDMETETYQIMQIETEVSSQIWRPQVKWINCNATHTRMQTIMTWRVEQSGEQRPDPSATDMQSGMDATWHANSHKPKYMNTGKTKMKTGQYQIVGMQNVQKNIVSYMMN